MMDGESLAAEPGGREHEDSRSLALRVTDLAVSYGHVAAVHSVSFTLREGECVALVGPNGNGKSSVVMGVAGLVARRAVSAATRFTTR